MDSSQNGSSMRTTSTDNGSGTGESNCEGKDFFTTLTSMKSCLEAYDRDNDGGLNLDEFKDLCFGIFRDAENVPYDIPPKILNELFEVFDLNEDGLIDEIEFEQCWNEWIKKIIRPVTALVIVDVQNDFITGSLAVSNCPAKQNGEEVVGPINRLLDLQFDYVFYSLDWHPEDHVSFIDNVRLRPIHTSSEIRDPGSAKVYDTVVFDGNPPMQQKLWPRHCVQNSWGARLHENLKVVEGSPFIYKGTNPDVDSYSAFWDNSKLAATTLFSELSAKEVTDVFICGLAYDVCVGATSLHSLELGFRTILIHDASRGIDFGDMENTRECITCRNGIVVNSQEVKALAQGQDRRVELGYKLGMELKGKLKSSSMSQ